MEALKMQQEGRFKEQENMLAAIIEEAKSKDKWTSRARPSFLYVIYVMILTGIPIGLLSVVAPDEAKQIAVGMQEWLGAIPEAMWTLFGIGYLGYTGAREYGKSKIVEFKKK